MKKITLLFLLAFSVLGFSQVDYYGVLTVNGGTSSLGRAPQGSRTVTRGVLIITAAEMAAGGYVNGDTVGGLGFTYEIGQDIPTTGTMSVYLQNTIDVTNTKSTTWATAINGMTTVSTGAVTIPNTAGDFNTEFSGGSGFVYTGGALYVAFDYQNLTNPLAGTSNIVSCNTTVTNGLKSALSAVGPGASAPTTIANSSFRPLIKLGKSVTCARPNSLNVASSTINSANLTWNAVGGANIEVEYGIYGFTKGSAAGTILTGAAIASPYNLTGLTASTVYQYYVRTNCGSGNFSAWNGPFSFNTTFEPTNLPYTTSFEQEKFSFLGWDNPSGVPVGSNWQIQNFGALNALVQEGSASVYGLSGVTNAPANNWILSRGLNLTAGATVTVSFYTRNYVDNGSTGSAAYNVTVGNTKTIADQTTNIGTEAAFTSAVWTLKSYNFVPTFTGTHYLGIQNVSPINTVGRQGLFIDNLSVSQVLSANDFASSNFNLYPNPASSLLSIESKNGMTLNSLTIKDINGRIIKSISKINATTSNLDVSELTSGVYFVTIETSEGSGTKKFIKQ